VLYLAIVAAIVIEVLVLMFDLRHLEASLSANGMAQPASFASVLTPVGPKKRISGLQEIN
jgi:hypothetical protein